MRSFRAHPSSLHEIRAFLRVEAGRERFSQAAVDDMVLAVSEASANSIIHTNSASIDIACRFSATMAEIQVRDKGVYRRRPSLGLSSEGRGRGIPLMMALMDEVSITEGTPSHPGTLIRLVKHLDQEQPGPD
jgi:anti-sigma regulatory factor (Ser/Thr protein kinase)